MVRGIDLDRWLDVISADIDKWEVKNGRTFMDDMWKDKKGVLEGWFDRHKRVMEFVRTFTSAIAAIASTIVLLKVW